MSPALLLPHHVDLLQRSAVDLGVADRAGVQSITSKAELPKPLAWADAPGLLFTWRTIDGDQVPQYRPDRPPEVDGRPQKYLFPKGETAAFNVHPDMAALVGTDKIIIVEGTKQCLAAVSHAPDGRLVIGTPGCWGWSHDGVPHPDLARLVPENADVVVVFDADVSTNRSVWDAGDRIRQAIEALGGHTRFASIPGSKTAGLDDYLASVPHDRRSGALAHLVNTAKKLGRAPKRAKPNPSGDGVEFVDQHGLRADALYQRLVEDHHLAVDAAGRICIYNADRGVYTAGRAQLVAALARYLGDDYRPSHRATIEELAAAHLTAAGRVIPDQPDSPLIGVRNGLLDPFTGELHPHTPQHLSTQQLPLGWNPGARCPTFDWYLEHASNGRSDDLLETVSRFLDRRPGQRKAPFLYGPTRSGKSTFIRTIEHIVGPELRSAVSLLSLASDRFAASTIYGKILNACADLPASHLDDVSLFKQMLGDDPVDAQFKYGQAFTYHCSALFIFSANEIPTVSEGSRAYYSRVRPFHFPHSFEGAEDPTIEQRIHSELEGVLVRLVEALQRFTARGGYLDDVRADDALATFARQSDRVRLFLWESTEPDITAWTSRAALLRAFERWCETNRRQPLGAHRFYGTLEAAGHRPAKRQGERGFAGLRLLDEDDWGPRGQDEASDATETCPRWGQPPPWPHDEPAPNAATGSTCDNATERTNQGAQGAGFTVFSLARDEKEEEEGHKEGRARGNREKAAPSAPSASELADTDPAEEVLEW